MTPCEFVACTGQIDWLLQPKPRGGLGGIKKSCSRQPLCPSLSFFASASSKSLLISASSACPLSRYPLPLPLPSPQCPQIILLECNNTTATNTSLIGFPLLQPLQSAPAPVLHSPPWMLATLQNLVAMEQEEVL
jgi:hypothetical protein